MSRWRRRPLFKLWLPVAGIFVIVIACGSDDAPAAIPASRAPTVAAALADLAAATEPAEARPTAAAEAAPTVAIEASADPDASTGPDSREVELGKAGFVHNDFRTQVETTIGVAESPALAAAQGRTFTVALRNLSSPNGDLSARATINFGSGFQNFVTLQGPDGDFRLYLTRDGELGTVPDDSGFR